MSSSSSSSSSYNDDEDENKEQKSNSSSNNNNNNNNKENQEKEGKLYYHCVTDTSSEKEHYVKICRVPDDDDDDDENDTETKNPDMKHADSQNKAAPSTPPPPTTTPQQPLPESVLQYQRQLRKVQAANRASNTTLTPSQHLKIIHQDGDIVVTNKPSGVLCVPGVNNNSSLLGLVYKQFGFQQHVVVDDEKKEGGGRRVVVKKRKKKRKKQQQQQQLQKKEKIVSMDNMIVHRLDMDTSGLVVFGRNDGVVKLLHEAFRDRKVTKKYEALLCGHLPQHINCGEINMALQRDHRHPPFMRISTPSSEMEASNAVKDLQHAGWKKIIMKKPKDSVTHFRVLKREMLIVETDKNEGGDGKGQMKSFPTTRVELIPVTGRTHQLRVHCAAIGHPIVADPAYGVWGEASPNGGFLEDDMDRMFPGRASLDLQRSIDSAVRRRCSVDEKEDGANKNDSDDIDSDLMCMCLHARELAFDHPVTGERMVFEVPPSF